ncbi:MAG TPA: hypothetical protein VKA21_00060, partial [Candidatus Binatia bacterium]|nr:hypothetical protein [Candidatus Binatia bacterium]
MCLVVTIAAALAAGVWTAPGGGMTFALAVDPGHPGTVYAGTGRGGIFESTDAGQSWRRLTRSRRPARIRALAVDGTGTAWASDADGRLVKRGATADAWDVVE